MYKPSINFSRYAKIGLVISLLLFFASFIKVSFWGVSKTFTGFELMINISDELDTKVNIWLILAVVSEVVTFFYLQ